MLYIIKAAILSRIVIDRHLRIPYKEQCHALPSGTQVISPNIDPLVCQKSTTSFSIDIAKVM